MDNKELEDIRKELSELQKKYNKYKLQTEVNTLTLIKIILGVMLVYFLFKVIISDYLIWNNQNNFEIFESSMQK